MARIRTGRGQPFKPLRQGAKVDCTEHADLGLEGLLPYSYVKCRVIGEARYTADGVQVNEAGALLEALKALKIHGLSADYEVLCQTPDGQVKFKLHLAATFSESEIDLMVHDMGSADVKWDATNGIPSEARDLEVRVDRFVGHYNILYETVTAIVSNPSQRLERQQAEVPVHTRFALGPRDLLDNVRRGLLDADARPTTARLLAQVEVATLDTSENSYIAYVSRCYTEVQEVLKGEVRQERKRLDNEQQISEGYELKDKKEQYDKILTRLDKLEEDLTKLSPLPVPVYWHRFSSPSTRATNKVRYDPLYAKVAELEDELKTLRLSQLEQELGSRKSLVELGKRRSWQLYEYWVVAKVYKTLRLLQFEPEDEQRGFGALLDARGAHYGLFEGSRVSLRHKEVKHLRVHIHYNSELARDEQGQQLRPDIRLELDSSSSAYKYGDMVLILDAKTQRLGNRQPHQSELTGIAYERSAKRYRRSKDRAAAYLLHPSDYIEWPARSGLGKQYSFLDDTDFPYLGGICSLNPSKGDAMHIHRILTAWFISNNLAAFCFWCGASFGEKCWEPLKEFSRPPCECHRCGMVVKVNHCMKCRELGVWSKIPKIYHKSKSDQQVTDRWVENIEIAARPTQIGKRGLRHCPKCGSDETRKRWT